MTNLVPYRQSASAMRLARIDFDDGDRRFIMHLAGGTMSLRVEVNRKSSGRIGGEAEVGGCTGGDVLLDIITMKMHDHRPIGRPSQVDDITLFGPDEAHIVRDAAALDMDVEVQLRRRGDGAGDEHHKQGQRRLKRGPAANGNAL